MSNAGPERIPGRSSRIVRLTDAVAACFCCPTVDNLKHTLLDVQAGCQAHEAGTMQIEGITMLHAFGRRQDHGKDDADFGRTSKLLRADPLKTMSL